MEASLLLEEAAVQEEFFERGWTDGLPVVPPTPQRVQALLDVVSAEDPDVLVGYLASRQRGVTIGKAATNAVMAGCRPEYFPVVVAAVEAMFDPAFNLHGVLTSTGGAALCAIVSGPIATEIGMNARHNALGEGNRANATIGRSLRLIASNVLGARAGESDGTSIGHPGRYSFCFAEDPPPAPWQPIRAQAGYAHADTTVSLVPVEGPHQLAQQLTDDATDVLRSFARSISHPTWMGTGKGSQGVLLLGPEHTGFCIAAGMSQDDVRAFVCEASRIAPTELTAAGVHLEQNSQHDMTPGPDGKLGSLRSPEDLLLVTAGGEGAGWSAWLPNWAPKVHAQRVTRRVRPAGEALPECGPDGCIVPAMRS
ncbi:hypothetical protein [Conexibacter sp. CPCC 206217]|uniref:hypothetical protein n=1 Tax=Conexibacter sp. CPCC 206217 TaxID=3064574 RepID=UPI00271D9667|nr:hypothetical protein [Conexibacter sp. CPCC 206217]MDO8208872.1 hypothetical protein [Conexibacter sp. CPCC 206217]